MKNRNKLYIALIALISSTSLFSQGIELKTNIHGFVSQGYLKSTDNNFLANSKDGSFEFNEAAVNFMVEVNSDLRIGVQLFARDLGTEDNNNVILDWAYGDYHWRDCLGIRFGKIKLPIGLFNHTRDVDFLRTAILLPQGIYDETLRDFTLAQQGAELYGYINIGVLNSIEYEIYLGTLTIPNAESTYWRWTFKAFSDSVLSQIPAEFNPDLSFDENLISGRYIWGFATRWNTPLSGMVIGASHLYGKIDLTSKGTMGITLNNVYSAMSLTNQIAVTIENYDVYSFTWPVGNLCLTAEYLKINLNILLNPDDPLEEFVSYLGAGYYGQIDYTFNDYLGLTSYYTEFYPNRYDKTGNNLIKELQLRAWQKDLCFAFRINLNSNWTVKLEGHIMDGVALAHRFDTNKLKRYWNLYAIKSSYHF